MSDPGIWISAVVLGVVAVGVATWWLTALVLAWIERGRIREWAKRMGLVEVAEGSALPGVLAGTTAQVRVTDGWVGERGFVLRVVTSTTPASRHPESPFAWTLVAVRRMGAETTVGSKATGLRPIAARVSWLDLYSVGHGRELVLLSFPSVECPDTFVVFGEDGSDGTQDVAATVALARSGHMADDLGVILRGEWVVVDATLKRFTAANLESVWTAASKIGTEGRD
jgi:hypothetical protein